MAGFRLSKQPIEPDRLKNDLRHAAAGALVTFEGWVRNHNDGKQVDQLEYEAFEVLAVSEGERIITEALVKFDILDAECVHRTGLLTIGEPAVWVGVVAAHRDAAYQANRYIIDHIKTRLPIWKKEYYVDGVAEWVNCQQCAAHHHPQVPPGQPGKPAPGGQSHGHPVKLGQQSLPKTAPGSDNKSQDRDSRRMQTPFSANDPNLRYLRQVMLPQVGTVGQQKLRQAKVLVVGAGGLGSAALQYLATAGIGHLGICEADTLEASNLNRQVLYRMDGLGQAKARLAASRLKAMNPDIHIYLHQERLTKATVMKTLAPYDLILDCTDNFPTRFLVNDTAVMMRKPVIQASIHQFEGQIHLYRPTESGCLRCMWPEAPRNGVIGDCSETGVIGAVPGVFGTLQAMEAIKFVLGLPTPLDQYLLIMDLLTLEIRKIRREKRPECQHGEDYLIAPAAPQPAPQSMPLPAPKATRMPAPEAPAAGIVAPHPPEPAPIMEPPDASTVIDVPADKPMPSPVEVAALASMRSNVVAFRRREEASSASEPRFDGDMESLWEADIDNPVVQRMVEDITLDEWELELMPWSRERLAEFTLVDIREAHERPNLKENPVAPLDYELLPYSRFDQRRLDRERKYLLLCQKGLYSAHLAAELRQQGYPNVYSLAGGVTRHNFSYLRDILNEQEADYGRG